MKIRSMRGQMIDMTQLAAVNANKIALGNASMNARGDLIGPGGHVVQSREQMMRDYHVSKPQAKQTALRDIKTEVFVSPAEALASSSDGRRTKRKIADSN